MRARLDGKLARDELHLLTLEAGGRKGLWTAVSVAGPTPGQRYGHSVNYKQPLIVLFGGSCAGETRNDTWVLAIDQTPLRWQQLLIEGPVPESRVYHSSGTFTFPETPNTLLIFGGRGKDLAARNDLWTLTHTSHSAWKWTQSAHKEDTSCARYQVGRK